MRECFIGYSAEVWGGGEGAWAAAQVVGDVIEQVKSPLPPPPSTRRGRCAVVRAAFLAGLLSPILIAAWLSQHWHPKLRIEPTPVILPYR